MDARRTDRIWLIGGIVAIVIIVAAAWLLAISPKFAEADTVQTEADDTTIQLTKLKKEVAALKAQDAKKATYQAQLDALVKNLPETYGQPTFVRMLKDIGTSTGVNVTVMSAGSTIESASVATAAEMPLSVTAAGTAENVSRFLVQLQQVQPRAALLNAVNLSTDEETGAVSANLTLTTFCTTADVADSAKSDRTDRCRIDA
ncbi:type 4a pilus biogenesis protein PilO [Paractinoplanes lichenicola]|uniref:Type 4a pilus biogenesis protein PilO n=1 Tax=Paractinoplanes lichenicola TaxID=2802976 RepID=A0ABS1W1K4_9ACTN|nr:type 4a pilus biogenesis protein PilO [Actinoplanes lichenicola]MBL7260616.1 type 4a pilus biogenesis protein PilO [Actinoplanes lichenicola]